MIKRTLYFGNPCFLRKKEMQLLITFPDVEQKVAPTIPIEDIGLIVLDNPQITLTNALVLALCENNTAVVSCDNSHMPYGLLLPMFSHHAFTARLGEQIAASLPLKKNLWRQTVIAKISNQAALLRLKGLKTDKLDFLLRQVRSDDNTNVEGRAAAYYWDSLFGEQGFTRHRYGEPPNNMLNYGYAILRAVVARSLIGSGLFPTIGIHHRNKYNPYCLADDIMEPYRPFVDALVLQVVEKIGVPEELSTDTKKRLLEIPLLDVIINGKRSPLMVGMQRTTSSLAACFEGSVRKLAYPSFIEI